MHQLVHTVLKYNVWVQPSTGITHLLPSIQVHSHLRFHLSLIGIIVITRNVPRSMCMVIAHHLLALVLVLVLVLVHLDPNTTLKVDTE
jgi:hypothetical protein